jgi:formate-dependent nitrite reductase cytochrome c552 subunit
MDAVDHTRCAGCHQQETQGFLEGRHGMRLARDLSPMQPAMARLPMQPAAAHRDLNCSACHQPHAFDTRRAAVEACLSCHNDAHSNAYLDSTHFALWQAELRGEASPGTGVSCATCHLPRETVGEGAARRVVVQHNQNANLRPNEKMLRTVCLHCHGLGFALDALADPGLIRANFRGRPSRHVPSLDLVERRRRENLNTKTLNPEPEP